MPPPIRKKLSEDELLAQGKDTGGRFISTSKSVVILRKRMLELNKTTKSQRKALDATNKSNASYNKGMRNQIRRLNISNARMRDSVKGLGRQRRATRAATTANRSFASSFLKIATASALAFGALKRVRSLAERKIQSAILVGPGSVSDLSRRQLLGINQSLQSNLQLRFGFGEQQKRALTSILEATKGVGTELSSKLLSDFIASFGADSQRLGQFIGDVNQRGVRAAIQRSASGTNIEAASGLLNAVTVQSQADAGGLSPVLQASVDFIDAKQKMEDAFDSVTETVTKDLAPALKAVANAMESVASGAAGLSTSEVAALGLGATAVGFIAGKKALGLVGKSLGVGGAGVSPATTGTIPSIQGFGSATSAARETARNTLGRRAGRFVGRALPYALGAGRLAGRASPYGALAVSAGIIGKGGIEAAGLIQDKRLERTALANLDKINDRLKEVLGGRTLTDALKDASAKAQILVNKRIAETKATSALSSLLDSAERKIKSLSASFKNLTSQTDSNRISNLQAQRVRLGDLTESRTEQQSIAAIRRAELTLAQTTPYGSLLAVPELRRLNQSIEKEIGILTQMLANSDESDKTGRIAANKLRAEIIGLRTDQRLNRRSLQKAFLDSAIGEVFGSSGAFTKLIIQADKNAGIGLRAGIFPRGLENVVGRYGDDIQHLKARSVTDLLKTELSNRSLTPAPSARGRTPGKTKVERMSQGLDRAADILKQTAAIARENEDRLDQLSDPGQPRSAGGLGARVIHGG